MARRRCSQWTPLDRGFDQELGIPLIVIKGDSRQALLARAKLLAVDPGYPPPYVINAVAELIARHVRI